MPSSRTRPFLIQPWVLLLGLLLIAAGLFGVYHQFLSKSQSVPAGLTTGLLCNIYSPPPVPSHSSGGDAKITQEVTSLTGATLKLIAPPKASVNETVVVSLCVEPKPGLPEQRQQALKNHLLVQLSAIGLQVDPRDKISAAASSPGCLGTAEWTVRANAPGRYSAVLVPESTDDQPNRPAAASAKPRWDFDLERPAPLGHSVSRPVDGFHPEILERALHWTRHHTGCHPDHVEPAAAQEGRDRLKPPHAPIPFALWNPQLPATPLKTGISYVQTSQIRLASRCRIGCYSRFPGVAGLFGGRHA